jgi:hypothetical protein
MSKTHPFHGPDADRWPPVAAWDPPMIAEYLECMDPDDADLAKALAAWRRPWWPSSVWDANGTVIGIRTAVISGLPSIVAKCVIDKAAAMTKSKITLKSIEKMLGI